jgi:small subunit ribosomal protein S17
MPETAQQSAARVPHHKEVIGKVVSDRMHKTIVVQVVRQKSHSFYGRVVSKAKKFYAHDEKNEAHTGDTVKLEETRPLSKLKRWKLKEVLQRAALAPEHTTEASA